jgi:hypothetical protein
LVGAELDQSPKLSAGLGLAAARPEATASACIAISAIGAGR